MNYPLNLAPDDRKELLTVSASELSIPAHVLEKDFWVTFMLEMLFHERDEFPVRMMFKGGTSLSKCYHCISRFSEDIDLALNREDLGFDDEKAPENQSSATQTRKRLKELKEQGIRYTSEELLPIIHSRLRNSLEEDFDIRVDEYSPENIRIEYPLCLEQEDYGPDDYVRPIILLETGTKAAHQPAEDIDVMPLFCQADSFPETGIDIEECTVSVHALSIARTFWEKITFVHQQASTDNAEKFKGRLSRHLDDIFQIYHSEHGEECLEDLDLLREVAQHKAVYFRQGGVDYESAARGELDLTLSDALREAFEDDYARMEEMFYEPAPEFGELIDTLSEIEEYVNSQFL